MKYETYNIEIGQPEERPGIVVEPIEDPVPRERPEPARPSPVKVPKKEPVPA